MSRLAGKVALVTGSSSGIGKAVALRYAEEGANLVICSNSSATEGMEVAELAAAHGIECRYVSADLGTEAGVKHVFRAVAETFGVLDILVNNAGRTFNVPFEDIRGFPPQRPSGQPRLYASQH